MSMSIERMRMSRKMIVGLVVWILNYDYSTITLLH